MEPAYKHPEAQPNVNDLWSLAAPGQLPRTPRTLLVAVATGGDRVDGDFEHAESFLLYEKDECGTCYIGRQLCPLLGAERDQEKRTRLLADCDLVLCSSISETCRRKLSALGIGCSLDHAGEAIAEAVASL